MTIISVRKLSGREQLLRDDRGATIVEFGLLIPVLGLLLMGMFDIGHSLYTRAILEGAVQGAARNSGLESGTEAANQASIDGYVRGQIRRLGIPDGDITITRRFYRSFSAAAAAAGEPFTDSNSNTRCDNGEPYEDRNHNRVRDADGGDAGQGGATDSVLYTVRLNYERMFPLYRFLGLSNRATVQASTVMNNQPYGDQGSYAPPVVRNCPA